MNQLRTECYDGEFFGELGSFANIDQLQVGAEMTWKWPPVFGKGVFNLIKIRPGLALAVYEYQLNQPVVVCFDEKTSPISIGFCLGGGNGFQVDFEVNPKLHMSLETGNGILCHCPKPCRSSNYPTSEPIRYVVIYIEPNVLCTLLNDTIIDLMSPDLQALIRGDRSICCMQAFPNTPSINTAAHQVFHSPYQGTLRKTYLEGKTLELITLAITQLAFHITKTSTGQKLLPFEVDCIQRAGRILTDNLERPPSLPELARRVGIHKDKLNKGFREIYGTSAFDFLRVYRLETAREMLRSRQKNVTEVAFEVGYNHPKNFTRAFKCYFGFNPSDYLR